MRTQRHPSFLWNFVWPMLLVGIIGFVTLTSAVPSVWARKKIKGVLSEIQAGKGKRGSQDDDDRKAAWGEALVSRSEKKAVKYLKRLIKRSKGKPNEAELWFRLSELYQKRAKSGRFFDLVKIEKKANEKGGKKDESLSLAQGPLNSIERKMLKKANGVYEKIQRDFPKFNKMDIVIFNNAFAYQRMEDSVKAEQLYRKLVEGYPQSKLLYDSYVAIGEIRYSNQDFFEAVESFRVVERAPDSPLYTYAIYKKGWAFYNMGSFKQAVISMKKVARLFDPRNKKNLLKRKVYNLRSESLSDLALFYYDFDKPKTAYRYFSKLTLNDKELSKMIFRLTSLYENRFREEDAIPIMLSYVKKNKKSSRRVEGYLFLVNSSQKIYEYRSAYKYMRVMHGLCLPKSKWIQAQEKDFSSDICKKDLNRVNLALADNWWKLWKRAKAGKSENLENFIEITTVSKKGKTKEEIKEIKENEQKQLRFSKKLRALKPALVASLVEKSFYLYLKRPGNKKDIKNRFAFADFLFQDESYKKATIQYARVGAYSMGFKPPKPHHEADYAAIVSWNTHVNKKVWEKKEYKQLKKLSGLYLKRHPKGKHHEGVRFQLGSVSYNRKDYDESETHLLLLAQKGKDKKIATESQDLILDILNFRKDFDRLVALSKGFMGNKVMDNKRKDFLMQIYLQSAFSQIERLAKETDMKKRELAAQKFRTYWRDNKQHKLAVKLAKEALWRSASIYVEVGNLYQGAVLSLNYATSYPQDKNNIKLLNNAAFAFEQVGQLRFAAESLLRLSNFSERSTQRDPKKEFRWKEVAAGYYALIGEKEKAHGLYWELIRKTKSASDKSKLLFRIVQMYKDKDTHPHHKGAVNLLIRLNQQPYAGEYALHEAKKFYASGKTKLAVAKAKSILKSTAEKQVKASAMFILAQEDEKRFFRQSLKATERNFAVILTRKGELLAKAQEKLEKTYEMSVTADLARDVLSKLVVVYNHFIEGVSKIELPKALMAEEAAVRQQLSGLYTPFEEKKKVLLEKIRKLTQKTGLVAKSAGKVNPFEGLEGEDIYTPQVKAAEPRDMAIYLPVM